MRRVAIFVLFCIVMIGFVVRMYKLTSSPPGLYTDESSIAYNAWSIATTGKDEHGIRLPMFFQAYGEWKLPVYIYSVALAMFVFGPVDMAVRLPSVLFGTATILIMFFLVKEVLEKAKLPYLTKVITPFIASLLLALSPWHFQFTRPGFEASSAVFFSVLSIWLFFIAVRKKQGMMLVLSVLSAVISLYAYSSARLVVPVVWGLLLLIHVRAFKLKISLAACLIGLIVALPFVKFSTSNAGMVRARQVSIFYQNDLKDKLPIVFVKNYLNNISPYYLFFYGDPTIAHMTPHRMGLHYAFELPFFILGLAFILKSRNKKLSFIASWMLIGFIPPAIAVGNPHALRGLMALPATIIISSLGLGLFLGKFRHNAYHAMLITFLVILEISTLHFLDTYHNKYIYTAVRDWQWDLKIMSQEVAKVSNTYSLVYFQKGIHKEAVLWYLRIHPTLYQRAVDSNRLGRYIFDVSIESIDNKAGPILFVAHEQTEYPGKEIISINLPDGQKGHRLWEL